MNCHHPNPQFARSGILLLNGTWSCRFDHGKSGAERHWEQSRGFETAINVPFCPESKLSGIGFTDFIEVGPGKTLCGLIKKISSRNPKQNNQYVIYPVDVVLGGKQLSIQDLTEDEVEMLDEIPEGQIIKNDKTGKIMICASEKFYLRAI